MEDKKMLEKIMDQNDKIIKFMVQQNQDIHELKDTVNNRFDRVESAILENSNGIKKNGEKIDKLSDQVQKLATNHEQRIRKLEHKAGV